MKKKRFLILPILVAICMLFSSCSEGIAVIKPLDYEGGYSASSLYTPEEVEIDLSSRSFDFDAIPEFDGIPYVVVNNNTPSFTDKELVTRSYEYYSRLDRYGRCGECEACVGRDIMPIEKRGAIGMVKPTGWQTVKYDGIDGNYLYNRCHLLGYQLTAENANERNLITGTRYLNVEGMLPFEEEVASYVKSTGNHVLYRVTPMFRDRELVARGVLMQGYSVEDGGRSVCFNVYCYNCQPNIEIDYATGKSRAVNSKYSYNDESGRGTYVLNTKSKKFHKPNCPSVEKIQKENKKSFSGSRDSLIGNGYSPCKSCNP